MPSDLQADVIVPIVNFMYTGTLEFHYSMYEKLLKTSREMNMTVLSKLLEAHRQTSAVPKTPQPVLLNKNAAAVRTPPKVFTQKPLPTKTVIYKQGQTIIKHVSPSKPNIPEPIQIVTRFQDKNTSSRPSRFIVPDEIVPDSEGSFETISYESKPLQTASQLKREDENSPFESLRRGYTNKRAATQSTSSQSPPVKKPNLDDIKAEAEAQSQRNELLDDPKEDQFFDGDDDDDDPDYDAGKFHIKIFNYYLIKFKFIDQYFDDDGSDDDMTKNNQNKSSPGSTVIKQTTKQITVSDCSGGNIDHAKILGEVLKKYPNLVKNPKNIKLKIMQKPSPNNPQQPTAIVRVIKQDGSNKIITASPNVVRPAAPSASSQPKKIDAKTMHELIKLGAENMKGPWLCLDCGSGGRPISIPTYKKFRSHLINIHKQKIDPRICEHCGLKPPRRIELIQHQLIAHNINPPADVQLFRCTAKSCIFVTQKEELLMKHKREVHKEFQQKCKYCAKVFNKEFLLHAHMRAVHRHMAKTDGTMDFSEDEEYDPSGANSSNTSDKKNKIEILSNIEIPASEALIVEGGTIVAQQPSSEAEALTNVASGIATSLALVDNVVMDDQYNIEQQLAQVHGEFEEPKKGESIITRLVAEDGTELQLTAAQKEEILQQLQQQGATLSDNVVMVLDQRQLGDEAFAGMAFSQESEDAASSSIASLKPEELEKAEIVFQDDPIKEKEEAPQKSSLIADLEGDWTEEERSQESKNEEVSSTTVSEEQVKKEEISPEETPKEESKGVANEELKNILNDWGDDDEADSTKGAEKTQPAEKSADVKDEPQTTTSATQDDGKLVEENEPSVLKEDQDAEMVDIKSEETPAKELDAPAEKSKIITELLDEWNDL